MNQQKLNVSRRRKHLRRQAKKRDLRLNRPHEMVPGRRAEMCITDAAARGVYTIERATELSMTYRRNRNKRLEHAFLLERTRAAAAERRRKLAAEEPLGML